MPQIEKTEIKLTDKYGASEIHIRIYTVATNDFPPKFIARYEIGDWGPRYMLNGGEPIDANDILDAHVAAIRSIQDMMSK